jgi:hypothetical protein
MNGGIGMNTYACNEFGNIGVVTPLDAGFLLAQPQNWKRRVDGLSVFQMLKGLDVRLLNMRYSGVRELVPYNTNQMFLERLYLGALVAHELLGSRCPLIPRHFEMDYVKRTAGACHFILAQHGSVAKQVWPYRFHPKDVKHSMSLDVEARDEGWLVGMETVTLEGGGLECDCRGERRPCAHCLAVMRVTRHEKVMAAIRLLESIRNYSRDELERLPFLKSIEIIWLAQCGL